MVGKGIVHLSRGPKEHHVRPAIDPQFRSAAQVYGQRVVGVLLSALLHDGVEGLKEIRRHGGLAIVQTPAEAGLPDMPRNALTMIEIDHCAPVAQIRDLMTRLPDLPKMPMGKSSSLTARTTTLTPVRMVSHVRDSSVRCRVHKRTRLAKAPASSML
jgi:two-component system chemotaxis response regulator CheB